jgi:anti-anti-sigma regulatory factor
VSTSYLTSQLTSTVIGLGTVGYISSASLTNLVSTANLLNLVSTSYLTSQLTSTVIGLGTVGYISSASLTNLVSTANLVNLVSTANLVNLVSTTYLTSQLTSTVVGLGTVGYVSTAALINHVSTANLVNLVSTSYLTSQLTSTVIGLGTVGYISSASLTNLVSTANLVNLVSTANLLNLVSTSYLTSQLTSTVVGLGTVGYVSTASLINHVSTANLVNLVSTSYLTSQLTSTVVGLGTVGYVSSASLTNLVSTANLLNLVSTANLLNLVSTSYLTSRLTSTVIGLGTVGYLSTTVIPDPLTLANYLKTPEIQFNSAVNNNITLTPRVTVGKVIVKGILDMCNNNIINTTVLQQSDLTSTVIGLGTVGYISTAGGMVTDPIYLGIGLYTPNIYNNSSNGNNLTVSATDYLNLDANCNVVISNCGLNMCNNSIYNVDTITAGSNLNLIPGYGYKATIQTDLDMCNNFISNVGLLSNSSTLNIYAGSGCNIYLHNTLNMCNYDIYNLSQIFGKSNGSGGGYGGSIFDFDYAHQGDIYMRGAYGDVIQIGNSIGGHGISLTLSNGIDKNRVTINGSAMANVHGTATIAAYSVQQTISDTHITGSSIIIVTPYDNLQNQSFWVTQTASTSFEINIAASLTYSVDFSYFIPRY